MGSAGLSGILDAIGHILHGPAKVFDHMLEKNYPNGETKFFAYFHTDTIKTALRGTGEMSHDDLTDDPKKYRREELKPIKSLKYALQTDTHQIFPCNYEGFYVLKNNCVYDPKNKVIHDRSPDDAKIVGYKKVPLGFRLRLNRLVSHPSILMRLVAITVIGTLVDVLACVIAYHNGEKRGYKRALRGEAPVNPASFSEFAGATAQGSHSSGSGWLLASAFSPIPLPLGKLARNHFAYPNPQLSAQIQQTATANWIKRNGSPPPYQATAPYPYQTPAYQYAQQPPPQQLQLTA